MAGNAILELGFMFIGIAISGSLAKKIDKSVIPFYILIGILMGPYVAGQLSLPYVGMTKSVDTFIKLSSELGIIFLLFFLGLEFSIDRLIENKVRIGKAGLVDLANLLVGILLGYLIFSSLLPALLLGGIVYISSSAIITKSLVEMNWIANDESEPILGVLVFEDIFIAIYLALMSILLASGEENDNSQLITTIVVLLAVFVFLILLVYFGKRFFQEILNIQNPEIFVLRAVALLVGIAGLALSLGMSEAVAAFFVGMGFSSTKHVKRLETSLLSMKDLFASIFFFWIGLKTNILLIPQIFELLLILVIVTTFSKFLTGYQAGKIYDLNRRRSIKAGLALVTRGEFSLIISTLVVTIPDISGSSVISDTIPSLTVAYVFVMSILGTLLMQYSKFFENLSFRKT